MSDFPHRWVMPRCLPRPHSPVPALLPVPDPCSDDARGRRVRSNVALPTGLVRKTATCCLGVLLTLVVPLAGRTEAASRAQASPTACLPPVQADAAFITEASQRFAIPERWICAVIEVESGWNANAISPRGAFGLMQIRPQTWVELSVRYHLGLDPFDPQDNIMAGSAYLREMLDRFGSEGAFAAYNAGPARYGQHLSTGRSLPDETQAYVTRLAPLIANEQRERGQSAVADRVERQQTSLFVQRSGGRPPDDVPAALMQFVSSSGAIRQRDEFALLPRATGLFVQRSVAVISP